MSEEAITFFIENVESVQQKMETVFNWVHKQIDLRKSSLLKQLKKIEEEFLNNQLSESPADVTSKFGNYSGKDFTMEDQRLTLSCNFANFESALANFGKIEILKETNFKKIKDPNSSSYVNFDRFAENPRIPLTKQTSNYTLAEPRRNEINPFLPKIDNKYDENILITYEDMLPSSDSIHKKLTLQKTAPVSSELPSKQEDNRYSESKFRKSTTCDFKTQSQEKSKTLSKLSSDNPILMKYLTITKPMYSICKQGSGNYKLNKPNGLYLNKASSEIYIADTFNNCVKVYTLNGEYKRQFGDRGKPKMSYPYSICMLRNTIYVSQDVDGNINGYNLKGDGVSQAGGKGSKPGFFNHIWGIAACEDYGEIYACDYMNNRVQVFDGKLNFIAIRIGESYIYRPKDINIIYDRVIILDSKEPCIHTFSKRGAFMCSIIGGGKDFGCMLQPMFFTIDEDNNIIISDWASNAVCIFSNKGNFCYKIGKEGEQLGEFRKPAGIAAYNEGHLIVVSQREYNIVQYF